MVGAAVVFVQGEVLFDDPGAEDHGGQRHNVARAVVGITGEAVEGALVGFQNVDVGAVDFAGVVGDALHQHQVFVAGGFDGPHSFVDFTHGRVAGGQHDRDAFAGGVVQHLQPGDLAAADLDERNLHVGAEVDGFLKVRGGGEVDADGLAVIGDFLVPFHRKFHVLEDFGDSAAPGAVHAVELHFAEAAFGDDGLRREGLELGAVRAGFLRGVNQALGLFLAAVEVAADFGDEVGRMVRADGFAADLDGFVEAHWFASPSVLVLNSLFV